MKVRDLLRMIERETAGFTWARVAAIGNLNTQTNADESLFPANRTTKWLPAPSIAFLNKLR